MSDDVVRHWFLEHKRFQTAWNDQLVEEKIEINQEKSRILAECQENEINIQVIWWKSIYDRKKIEL